MKYIKIFTIDEQQREQRLDELLDWRDQINDNAVTPEKEG